MTMKNNRDHDEICELYKKTFDSVHASDELKRKVECMADNKKRLFTSKMKKFAAVAAIATIVFTTGNLAAYAATGNNILAMITIKVNGDEINSDIELEKKTDEDGRSYYEGSYENENGNVDVWISDEYAEDGEYSITVTQDGEGEDTEEVTQTVELKLGTENK